MKLCGLEFIRTKFDGLDGKTKVSWAASTGTFQVVADQSGINFKGEFLDPLSSRQDLNEFAELIGMAWGEHLKLAPKLTKSLSGH